MSEQASIGEAATRTGVKTETIRYYERIGLVRKPRRTGGGHRIYDGDELARLGFIRRARELGFPIQEVRGLLNLVDDPGHTCEEVHTVASEHAARVRAKIEDLQAMQSVLDETITQCAGGTIPDCPLISALQPRPGTPASPHAPVTNSDL